MSGYALPIQRLIKEFSRFPGIGEKTAARLVNHVLHASEEEVHRFAESLLDVKRKILSLIHILTLPTIYSV